MEFPVERIRETASLAKPGTGKKRERFVLPSRFRIRTRKWERVMKTSFHGLATIAAVSAALALSSCGTTPGDRAVSGGLLGAGAGAAIGSLSGNAGTGAIIGGVGGAAVGALSDPCTLNLGDPWWRDHGGDAEYHRRCGG
jgi:osmotically inducible lipoprotein OsmB